MSWNEGQMLVNNLQQRHGNTPNDIRSMVQYTNRQVHYSKYDHGTLVEKVLEFEHAVDRQQAELDRLRLLTNTMKQFIEMLEQTVADKFEEVDDNIEKLWYAPGGPAVACMENRYR